jgi:hypothetical protein
MQRKSNYIPVASYKKVVMTFAVFLFLFNFSTPSKAQFYNGLQMPFGKNRVQYIDFLWSFYRFEKYDTYFYVGGQNLASYTAQAADVEIPAMEKFLDYQYDGKIKFIIFNKLSDYKQSNIGIYDEEENNTSGLTRISGNKIFLYFNGNHDDFRRQIKSGIAQILITQMMYGGDLRERVQNAAVLVLPDWYTKGLVSYSSVNWNVDIDNRMRDGILSGKYKKFNRLEGRDAVYAGHSIWAYIADTYGQASIPNVLYMTKNGRNIENGFLYVLGVSLKTLTQNWQDYYKKKYADADAARALQTQKPIIKRPKTIIFGQPKISPDGRYLAYSTNDLGRYKVWLYDSNNKTKKVLHRGGYRSLSQKNDETFPLLGWSPDGKNLSMIKEYHGKIIMREYNIATKKTIENTILNFEKILDFSYADNPEVIAMSAVQKGQTDIYVFNLRKRTAEQVTRDVFDDVNPHFVNGDKAIIFSSNRSNDTLFVDSKNAITPSNTYDLFMYNYKQKNFILQRITNTPNTNESQLGVYDKENLSFISDDNGITNRYIAHIDSTISSIDTVINYRTVVATYPQTNYPRNIMAQDVNYKKKKYADVVFTNGKYEMYFADLPKASRVREHLEYTNYKNSLVNTSARAKRDSVEKTTKPLVPVTDTVRLDSNHIDINNYVFQSDFPRAKKKKKKLAENIAKVDSSLIMDSRNSIQEDKQKEFVLPLQRLYETAFTPDYFVTQFGNNILSPTYQLFTGSYNNPSLDALIKIGTGDLFEDYKFVGGFVVPFNLNSTEYFLSFENLKKRLDKKIVFHRKADVFVNADNTQAAKLTIHELQYSNKWPFSPISAVQGTLGLRSDRVVYLSTSQAPLQAPNQDFYFGSAKADYTFDNTISKGLNLYNGTRYKLFAEAYKQLDKANTTIYTLGFDIRHYEKIHRNIIWANRLAASTSFGDQKVLYYLGGVDNPLLTRTNGGFIPTFDQTVPIDYSQNYFYQSLATNMRGFAQNVRNGNNFVVFNSELRFPVFSYFISKPIKSDFIKNFQLIGFSDLGTAWSGKTPYSNNILNTRTIYNNPVSITFTTQKDPFVYSDGFGLRSKILGYFVRADWAWGVEDKAVQPRIFYLSLNLDF